MRYPDFLQQMNDQLRAAIDSAVVIHVGNWASVPRVDTIHFYHIKEMDNRDNNSRDLTVFFDVFTREDEVDHLLIAAWARHSELQQKIEEQLLTIEEATLLHEGWQYEAQFVPTYMSRLTITAYLHQPCL